MKTSIALILIAACGGGGGGSTDGGGGSADAGSKVFMDAPPPITATMLKVSGTASASDNNGSTPLPGVVVAFYKSSDETTPLAMQTSDATGAYSFMIPTGGVAVDGFVEATIGGYATTYLYPKAALTADFAADVGVVTSINFSLLGGVSGQDPNKGFITAVILDANDAVVTGATVTSSPASTYRYTASGGIPSGMGGTVADGVGYFINAPVGTITISASKTSTTFKSVTLKAHAKSLTTTTITP
jgi:hypothetical protein